MLIEKNRFLSELKFSSSMTFKCLPFLRSFSDIPGVECRNNSEFEELHSCLLILMKTNFSEWFDGENAKYSAIYFISRRLAITEAVEI